MGSLKKMKMTFTFQEKQQSEHVLSMAARKYNKYRENQLSGGRTRNIPFSFVKPWWTLWTEKMIIASG